MKQILFLLIIGMLPLLSACKPQKEKSQALATDTLSAIKAEPLFVEPPLEGGDVTICEADFGPLVELEGRNQPFDEEGPIFKISEPEVLVTNQGFLFQNRPALTRTVLLREDGTMDVKVNSAGEKSLSSFFHWYRLPDFKHIVSMGVMGGGPDEFMYPHLVQSCRKGAGPYLCETTTGKLYATDTTGILKPVPVDLNEKNDAFVSMQFVVAAPDSIYSVENVRGGKAIFRTLLRGDSVTKEQVYNLSFSKKHRGWAAYIGDFAMSPSGNRIVYAYKYFRKLVVMDKEAQVVRTISFEAEGVDAKDNVKTLGPDNVTYYWGISATERHFFLVYSGRTPLKVVQECAKSDGYIFVEQYDWAGNPVARYRLNHWGKAFADGITFYQLCSSYDDPLFLYTIPEK